MIDTGSGIPEDVLAHIFEPFYATRESGKGTGLGLALVQHVVEEHGGKSRVDSRVASILLSPCCCPVFPRCSRQKMKEGRFLNVDSGKNNDEFRQKWYSANVNTAGREGELWTW